jgi:hypothetical protein
MCMRSRSHCGSIDGSASWYAFAADRSNSGGSKKSFSWGSHQTRCMPPVRTHALDPHAPPAVVGGVVGDGGRLHVRGGLGRGSTSDGRALLGAAVLGAALGVGAGVAGRRGAGGGAGVDVGVAVDGGVFAAVFVVVARPAATVPGCCRPIGVVVVVVDVLTRSVVVIVDVHRSGPSPTDHQRHDRQ